MLAAEESVPVSARWCFGISGFFCIALAGIAVFLTKDNAAAVSAFVLVGALLVYLGLSGQYLLSVNKDGAALTMPYRRIINEVLDAVEEAEIPLDAKESIAEVAQQPERARSYKTEREAFDPVYAVIERLGKLYGLKVDREPTVESVGDQAGSKRVLRPDFLLTTSDGARVVLEFRRKWSTQTHAQLQSYIDATNATLAVVLLTDPHSGVTKHGQIYVAGLGDGLDLDTLLRAAFDDMAISRRSTATS